VPARRKAALPSHEARSTISETYEYAQEEVFL
jgi:hypothetical protein